MYQKFNSLYREHLPKCTSKSDITFNYEELNDINSMKISISKAICQIY